MSFLLYMLLFTVLIIPYTVASTDTVFVPGLSFHPAPPYEGQSDSSLIWYKAHDKNDVKKWTEKLDAFLRVYKVQGLTPGRGQNLRACDFRNPPEEGQVCDVDIQNLGPCTQDNQYGFPRRSPCIFIKFEMPPSWTPVFYNNTINLPPQMPEALKAHIAAQEMEDRRAANKVWLTCDGFNPADRENIGSVQYFPSPGFPGYFYPHSGQEGYLSPLLAIHFERPMYGIVIGIECKVWARNIVNNQTQSTGYLQFDLLID